MHTFWPIRFGHSNRFTRFSKFLSAFSISLWICEYLLIPIANDLPALSKRKGDAGSSCHTVQHNSRRLDLPRLMIAGSYFYWSIHHLKHTERKSFTESSVQFVAKSIRTCGLARWKSLNSILFWIKVVFHLSLTQFGLQKMAVFHVGNWLSIVWAEFRGKFSEAIINLFSIHDLIVWFRFLSCELFG